MLAKKQQLDSHVEELFVQPSVSRAEKIMQSRYGTWLLGLVSFIESALPVPIITDPFLIAAILLDRKRSWYFVLYTIVSSVIGGIAAYFMAALFFDWLMQFMSAGVTEQFNALVASNDTNTFLLTLLGAVTPIPYTLVAYAVAVLEGSLLLFIAASVIGRSFRYIVVGYSVYKFGPYAVQYAKRYLGITSILLVLLAAVLFYLSM